ncbi:hypothetical protein P5673_004058 [Acropora cervicornis]|uniref:Uncharacterized protein n=1 Tax=Acropora cervicornis TaxID=6130 RepID=A0AAD9R2C6_ACRCE|nr:hypothetical protein P5673_004058 [Acropora cervicornis]
MDSRWVHVTMSFHKIFHKRGSEKVKTVDVDKLRRRRDLAMGSGSEQIYSFQIAAFKIIRGGEATKL